MGNGNQPTSSPVALELRIHGVHNTPPSSMLGIEQSDVVQVAGDGLTGFYRSRSGELPYRTGRDGLAVEAYSWGALTSGARGFFGWVRRALWLLLLPFALCNLAYWARLTLGRDTLESRLAAAAVRTASLLVTVFFTVIATTVFVDLIGWQCYRGGSPACPGVPSFFDFLGNRTAGQRLAISTLGPLLFVGVLYLLSNRTLARYEATADPMADPLSAAGRRNPDAHLLSHPNLWSGTVRTQTLRNAHVAVALATIVAFSAIHVRYVWTSKVAPAWPVLLDVTLVVAAVVVGLSFVLVCCTLDGDVERQLIPRRVEARGGGRRASLVQASSWLLGVSFATVLVHLVELSLHPRGGYDELSDFHGRNAWFVGLFIVLTALHLSVFAGGRLTGWRKPVVPLGVAGLLVAGCAVVYAPFLTGGRLGTDGSHASLIVVLVLIELIFVALAWWHYRLAGRAHRAAVRDEAALSDPANPHPPEPLSLATHPYAVSGFAGAGASVFLAAAAWTALLFATAAVIGAANVLDGSATVSTLVTSLPGSEKPAPPSAYSQQAVPSLAVSGKVTLSGAVYRLREGRLTVYSGAVRVGSASLGSDQGSGDQGLQTLQKSKRYDAAQIALPARSVRVENSCRVSVVGEPTADDLVCLGESPGFNSDGSLRVESQRLDIDAPGRMVSLKVARPGYTPLVIPQVMVWAPLAQVLWLIALGLTTVWCVLRYRRRAAPRITADDDYDDVPASDRPGARAARASAGLAHRAERLLDFSGPATAPIALALIVASSRGKAPWEEFAWTKPIADASLYAVLGVALGLVLLGSRIRTSEMVRRAVGVIWDLATFWPRAAHPLAPPCYAERIVPEITKRVLWAHQVSGDRQVVLSGHSQGSLVLVAVAARLEHLERVRLITYGSQIRALYGRVFPAVFGSHVVGYVSTTGPALLGEAEPDLHTEQVPPRAAPPESLRGRLASPAHWVNLFRRTDPLGFRVFSDHDSGSDVRTLEVPVADMGDPGPPVQGHSNYQHTPEYRQVVCGWTKEEVVEPPGSTTAVTPLPAP